MPQVKPERGARDPSHPAAQFRASASFGSTGNFLTRQSNSKTWIRPQLADKSAPAAGPGPAVLQNVQRSVGSSLSSLPNTPRFRQIPTTSKPLPQTAYVSRKKNTLTRIQAGPTSSASAETGSLQNVSLETRRLIHQGRHKLIQQPQHKAYPQSGPNIRTPNALQQYRRFVSAQSRKRAGSALSAPTAKRANTWVRNGVSSAAGFAATTSSSKLSVASYVRSTHSRKLQLVRRHTSNSLTVPATPTSRLQSRGAVLARQLLSARSLKRPRRPTLTLRNSGVAEPGKLQRIDGVLYKVGGSGPGRSLQRQITPKSVKPLLSPEGAYVRQGKHLVLRSILTSPKAVLKRVSTARSQASSRVTAAKVSARQKVAAVRTKRPNRLRKSSSAQTHCLIYCRTGQCRDQQAGKCHLVHEPAAVAVCPRWLQGSCNDSACKLQHQRCPDVMPVCTFYLQGVCTTEDCPYAHVKVDPNAPVCQEFVSGHCPRGVACTKKHLTPRMIRQLRQSKALQADQCTSQQSTSSAGQAHAAEAAKPRLQDEDIDLRPSFLR